MYLMTMREAGTNTTDQQVNENEDDVIVYVYYSGCSILMVTTLLWIGNIASKTWNCHRNTSINERRSEVRRVAPRHQTLVILDLCSCPLQICIFLMGLHGNALLDLALWTKICVVLWFVYDVMALRTLFHVPELGEPGHGMITLHGLYIKIALTVGFFRLALFFQSGAVPFLLCCTTMLVLPTTVVIFLRIVTLHREKGLGSTGLVERLCCLYAPTLPLLHVVSIIARLSSCWGRPCLLFLTSWTFTYLPIAALVALFVAISREEDDGNHCGQNLQYLPEEGRVLSLAFTILTLALWSDDASRGRHCLLLVWTSLSLLLTLSVLIYSAISRYSISNIPPREGHVQSSQPLTSSSSSQHVTIVMNITNINSCDVPTIQRTRISFRRWSTLSFHRGVKSLLQSRTSSDECAICMEQFEQQITDKGPIRLLKPCGHYFHFDCVGTWLETGHITCPICREKVNVEQILQLSYATLQRMLVRQTCQDSMNTA